MADDGIEESTAQGSGDASFITSCKDPEIRRLSVTPLLRQYSPSPLSSIADMDLVELSLIDVLTQAATDVLGSIPAQHCVVYIYDKAANLLRPQVVVDCHDQDLEGASVQAKDTSSGNLSVVTSKSKTSNSIAEEEMATSSLVSFPPVVGMVSSCFLQRRCLRMQEPNRHRSFHREYDVPKGMLVDSILCAPVILYHRATAVIQLLNRLDTARDRNSFEEVERATTPHDMKNESTSEVKLRRLKTVKTVLTGFSSKDEQKLLHFTTHIAQTIETNAKKLASVRSHAKIREDKAKQALELLNALNGKVVARVNSTDMLLSTGEGGCTYTRRATITRLSSQKSDINMLGALVVIMRLQALFRGRRVRRAEKFAEELEKFRRQRERMKTPIVMQRVVSSPEPPKAEGFESPPPGKARKPASRSKKRDKEPKKAPPSPPAPITPITPRPPPQPAAPSPRPSTQPKRIQKRRMSAVKIQKVFRRHRLRRKAIELSSPAKPVAVPKEVVSAVKVQSFIRGNLVRKKLRRSLLSLTGPHIVCLRVASSSEPVSNQTTHDYGPLRSQTCVYIMPERPGKTPHAQRRISTVYPNQEQLDNELRPQNTPGIAVASRRLVAMHKGDGTRVQKSPFCRSRPRWDRLVPSVVWDTVKKPELTPGVEFVKQHRLKDRKENSPRRASVAVDTNQKPTVRLPGLPQPTSALLCCLLPMQTTSNGLIAARPVLQTDRNAIRVKRRHSPE